MQPTGIQPSQLLMEVVASAKDKIGQNIAGSEFSQQLLEQHQLAQHPLSGGSAPIMTQSETAAQNPPALAQQSLTVQTTQDGGRQTKADAAGVKGSTDVAGARVSARNLAISKWKVAQELTFTDTVPLESVLAQYRVGPSITSAIRDARDGQGQITLQTLTKILDRASSAADESTIEGTVPASEIQSLLATVPQQKQIPVPSLQELAIRTKGTYDFGEFREVLRRLVDQVAIATVKQAKAEKSLRPQSSESEAGDIKLAVDPVSLSRSKLPNQTQSLTANLIPSFMRDNKGPFDNLDARLPVIDVSAPAADKAVPTEALTAEEISGGALPLLSRPNVGLTSDADTPSGSTATKIAAGWFQEVGQWPQAFSEVIASIMPTAPLEASSATVIDGQTVPMGQPRLFSESTDGFAWKHDTASSVAATDKQGVLLSSVNALASALSTGTAAFQPMRSGPAVTDIIPEVNPVAETGAAGTPIPVVEKIAAPTMVGLTSSDPRAPGSRDFARNGLSSTGQQDPRRPAGIRVKSVFPDDLPEAPASFPAEVAADAHDLHNIATPPDAGGKVVLTGPPNRPAERTLLKGVIEIETATRPTALGPDGVLEQPVKAETSPEIPPVSDRLRETVTAGLVSKAPSPFRPVAAESSVAPLRNHAAADFSGNDRSFSNVGLAGLSTNPATTGRSTARQAEPTGYEAMDAARGLSNKIALSSAENPQAVISTILSELEAASPVAAVDEAISSDTPGQRPFLTGDIGGFGAGVEILAAVQRDSQVPIISEDFNTTDQAKPSPDSNRLAGVAGPETWLGFNLDHSGEATTDAAEPITKPALPNVQPGDARQKPGAGLKSLTERDFKVVSRMGDVVSSQMAGEKETSLVPAGSSQDAGDSRSVTATIATRIVSPSGSERTATARVTVPEAPLPGQSQGVSPSNGELPVRGTVESEATPGNNASASANATERTTRHNPLEASTRETLVEPKGEKAVPVAEGSEQAPSHGQEQRQDQPSTWLGHDVQVAAPAANPPAEKATQLFSSFTSSLTAELAQRILELHRENRHELTLELQPEHLGRLRVRIGTEDNQVTTLISAESEHVKELLTRGSSSLRQELASQGLVLEKLQIDVNSQASAHDQSFSRQEWGTRRNGSRRQLASANKGFPEPTVRGTHFTNGNTLLSVFV